MVKKLLAVAAAVCLLMTVCIAGASAEQLTANAKNEYRILVIPDAHQTRSTDLNMTYFVQATTKYMVETEKQKIDLVVLLGDMVTGSACLDKQYLSDAMDELLKPVFEIGAPFTVVFGEDDYDDLLEVFKEQGNGKTNVKNWLLDQYEEKAEAAKNAGITTATFIRPTAYFEDGGASNLCVPVMKKVGEVDAEPEEEGTTEPAEEEGEGGGETNTDPAPEKVPVYEPYFNLFFFDTGDLDEGQTGLDYVRKSQLDWFKELNGDGSVPALIFQHIPMREVYGESYFLSLPFALPFGWTASVNGKHYLGQANYLKMNSTVLQTPSVPNYSDGEFETISEKGNVRAVFFGHDHMNNYIVRYPNKNLDLVQLPGATWDGGDATFLTRGATFIRVYEDSSGEMAYTHELFTYRQASRVNGSKVTSATNGFSDVVMVFPYLWQTMLRGITAPFRWINGWV